MSTYRFKLEPYKGVKTRHTCPACERSRCFARYIDTEGALTFPDHVGRCDHEQRCGYHYTPKAYFADDPTAREGLQTSPEVVFKPSEPAPPSFIDRAVMEQTLKGYESNNLYRFLSCRICSVSAMQLMKDYRVGSSKHWAGATVFWQIDSDGGVRAGKIMLYDPETGKRVKKPFNHITWVHSLLSRPNYNLHQCLFGEHRLSEERSKPVALVESEKTALIAAHYLPQYLWLATGGKHGCFKRSSLSPLKGRQVVLFPDLGATDYWREKMAMMQSMGIEVQLFDYLEKHAPAQDQQEGYDIADYLLKIKPKASALEEFIKLNPNIQLLVDKLGLREVKEHSLPSLPPRRKGLRR